MATYRIPVGRFTVVIDTDKYQSSGEGKILDAAGVEVPFRHDNVAVVCLMHAEQLEAEAARKDVIHARWDHLETNLWGVILDHIRELRGLTGWAKDEAKGGNP